MELNQYIDLAQQFKSSPSKQTSMQQDNANKAAFALNMIARQPSEPVKEEPPKIPSLGALAIPN